MTWRAASAGKPAGATVQHFLSPPRGVDDSGGPRLEDSPGWSAADHDIDAAAAVLASLSPAGRADQSPAAAASAAAGPRLSPRQLASGYGVQHEPLDASFNVSLEIDGLLNDTGSDSESDDSVLSFFLRDFVLSPVSARRRPAASSPRGCPTQPRPEVWRPRERNKHGDQPTRKRGQSPAVLQRTASHPPQPARGTARSRGHRITLRRRGRQRVTVSQGVHHPNLMNAGTGCGIGADNVVTMSGLARNDADHAFFDAVPDDGQPSAPLPPCSATDGSTAHAHPAGSTTFDSSTVGAASNKRRRSSGSGAAVAPGSMILERRHKRARTSKTNTPKPRRGAKQASAAAAASASHAGRGSKSADARTAAAVSSSVDASRRAHSSYKYQVVRELSVPGVKVVLRKVAP